MSTVLRIDPIHGSEDWVLGTEGHCRTGRVDEMIIILLWGHFSLDLNDKFYVKGTKHSKVKS